MMRRAQRTELLYALLFIAPFLLYLLIFHGFAFVRAIYFSLTDKGLFNNPSFVGLSNYAYLFRDERFLLALQHSIAYTLVVTVIQTFLALALAAVLNQKLRGITFFRTVYYIPSILSSAAVTVIAIWFFQKTGFLNSLSAWFTAYAPVILALDIHPGASGASRLGAQPRASNCAYRPGPGDDFAGGRHRPDLDFHRHRFGCSAARPAARFRLALQHQHLPEHPHPAVGDHDAQHLHHHPHPDADLPRRAARHSP